MNSPRDPDIEGSGDMTTGTTATRKTAILAIICVSYFMVILDNSIIFTGLPRIESAMGFTPTGLAWVQDAYTLVFGGLLLLGARAGDIVGRRRMFVAGLVLFGVASFLVGVAPYAWWLIAARAVQGIGAAVLAPSSLALLAAHFDGRERARAIAVYSAVAGIGASAGLVVGGVLADWISWRAGFFLNVPLGIAMLVAARRYLARADTAGRGRFDVVGAVSATAGMTAIVFAVIESASAGWSSPVVVGALLAGTVLLVVLVVNEARVRQPIMPLRLFAARERTGAYLVRLLYLGAMIGFFFFTTQYLQDVLGYNPLRAGLAFLPMTAVNFAVAVVVNRIVAGIGRNATLVAGVAATLAGMAWLSRVDAHSGYLAAVAAPMVLIGAGQGLAFAPMTAAGLVGVSGADAGAASGVINTFHQLGSALGLSVLTAIGAASAAASTDTRAALVGRVDGALLGGTGLLVIALLLVLVLIAGRRTAPRPATTDTASARKEPVHA